MLKYNKINDKSTKRL